MVALRAVGPIGGSVGFHLLLLALVSGLALRRAPPPEEALQITVIDAPPAPAPA